MRGQRPGSEHERGEADSAIAPSTPPPSFGHQPPSGDSPYGTPGGHRADPYASSGEHPATPYIPPGEPRPPSAYPEPSAAYPEPSVEEAEGWLSVEGEPRAREGWPSPEDD